MAVWRLIAHHDPQDAEAQIQAFLDLGYIAIGWSRVGDLRPRRPADAAEITQLIQALYPGLDNGQLGGPSLWRLYAWVGVGDLVIVGDGNKRRAVMRVSGGYTFTHESRAGNLGGYSHRRRAEYVACDPEALWTACGAAFAAGENQRWTLARCEGGDVG